MGSLLGVGGLLNLLAHYPCSRRTINNTKTLLGDCATSNDNVVIYGIVLIYDYELKMLFRPEKPVYTALMHGAKHLSMVNQIIAIAHKVPSLSVN